MPLAPTYSVLKVDLRKSCLIELLFNLLSQMITVSTIKLTSQPVREYLLEYDAWKNQTNLKKIENLQNFQGNQ